MLNKFKIIAVVAVLVVGVIFVGLAAVKVLQIRKMIGFAKTFVPPPDTVPPLTGLATTRTSAWFVKKVRANTVPRLLVPPAEVMP